MGNAMHKTLANLLWKANAGMYPEKQLFYEHVKKPILSIYGVSDGYDLQTIKKKCWSCDGTGIYKHYHYEYGERFLVKQEECWNCSNGIYETKYIWLKRSIINGIIYHTPVILPFMSAKPEPKNRINGLIEHKPVKHARASFFMLLFIYNRGVFFLQIRKMITRCRLDAKYWLDTRCRLNAKYRLIRLVNSIRSSKQLDELPF